MQRALRTPRKPRFKWFFFHSLRNCTDNVLQNIYTEQNWMSCTLAPMYLRAENCEGMRQWRVFVWCDSDVLMCLTCCHIVTQCYVYGSSFSCPEHSTLSIVLVTLYPSNNSRTVYPVNTLSYCWIFRVTLPTWIALSPPIYVDLQAILDVTTFKLELSTWWAALLLFGCKTHKWPVSSVINSILSSSTVKPVLHFTTT